MVSAPPAAISFDFWNTLVPEPGGVLSALRREAVVRALLEHEVEVEEEVLDAHLEAAHALHTAAWHGTESFAPEQAARHLAEAIEGLDEDGRERVAGAFVGAGAEAELELTPRAAETVAALAERGVQLGIVCDVGLTGSPHLRAALDRAGILTHFRGWAFSDEVGHFKPSREIFRRMLDRFELPDGAASTVWHVGDLRRTDVAGARASGLVPIRFRGIADDRSEAADADHVIDDLTQLLDLAAGTAGEFASESA